MCACDLHRSGQAENGSNSESEVGKERARSSENDRGREGEHV